MTNSRNEILRSGFEKVAGFLSYLSANSWKFKTLYTEAYFDWKIGANPNPNSFCVLRYQGGATAAHLSITAKPLNPFLGIGQHCGELGDSHTHPNFQKQGHFSAVANEVIAGFLQQREGQTFIFGIPNESSLHGYQSRCNCKLVEAIKIWEFSEKIAINLRRKSRVLTRVDRKNKDLKPLIDSIWNNSARKHSSLYLKNFDWVDWRYLQSTEEYSVFFLRNEAYLIVKISRKKIFTLYEICEVFGLSEEAELSAVREFIRQNTKSLSMVVIWASEATQLADFLWKNNFTPRRSINFMIHDNDATRRFMAAATKLEFRLGDSDNA